ncbi:MAG: pyrroline-5-carboxylate reductase [Kiritimatiellae bacterium]|nr:pyrroline-5-carboxylate reductase [Kiritimatiellia bacterium]
MKIGFLGSGKMAEAILSGILQSELVAPCDVIACDTSDERLNLMKSEYSVETTRNAAEMVKSCSVVVLAVKPQVMELVLEEVKDLFTDEHLLISIAAGKKLAFLRGACGDKPRLVRVMPNLALMAQEGMSVFCMDDKDADPDRELTSRIFGSSGSVLELNEEYFDAVTALSGSGPAFVAYLLKGMIDGAVKQGLAEDAACLMAEQTMIGTGIYLQQSGRDIGEFIQAVCSPKGTTEAGMNVLNSSDVAETLGKTLAAAADRSRELS